MKNNKQWLIRRLLFWFTVSISITVLPCGVIHTYSLFGEITSSVVTNDNDSEISDESYKIESRKQVVGISFYNIWFEIWIFVICIIFVEHMRRLPRENTVVTLKIRMNN